jgi:hypothetical protein
MALTNHCCTTLIFGLFIAQWISNCFATLEQWTRTSWFTLPFTVGLTRTRIITIANNNIGGLAKKKFKEKEG